MTDSLHPRHRNKERRGLIGPIVSALAVLLAIGPVLWLMTSRDGSTVTEDRPEVLTVGEDNSGPGAYDSDQSTALPQTTSPAMTPALTPTLTPSPTRPPATTPTGTPLTTPVRPVVTRTPGRRVTAPSRTRATPRPSDPTTSRRTGASTTPRPRRTPTPTATTTQPPAPPSSGGGTNAQEQQVLDLTNAARRQNGCGPLSLDSSLVEAAGRHASDMVQRHFFDHTNPDGKDPFERMQAAGFRGGAMGENIAAGQGSAASAMDAWMHSDGHRRNILNCDYNKIGIGYDPGEVKSGMRGSWVQNFGRS